MGGNGVLLAESLWQDEVGKMAGNLMLPSEDEANLFSRQENLCRNNIKIPTWTLLSCTDFILGTNYQALASRLDELDDGGAVTTGEGPTIENISVLLLHKPERTVLYLKQNNHPKEVIDVYCLLLMAVESGALKDLRTEEQKKEGRGQPTVNPRAFIDWARKNQPDWPIAPDTRLIENREVWESMVVVDGKPRDLPFPVEPAILKTIQQGRLLTEGQRKRIEVRALAVVIQAATKPMRKGELWEHREIDASLNTMETRRKKDVEKRWLQPVALCRKAGASSSNQDKSKNE